MTFRTTFRETRKLRQIALIVIFREKYASISNSAPKEIRRPVWTLIPGARLDADHPESGVLIPRRFILIGRRIGGQHQA
jgi:hypothetical protein